jgi:hypothetical protein
MRHLTIRNAGGSNPGYGAGIANLGQLTIADSRFENNRAVNGGGTFTDVTLDSFMAATVIDITFNTGDTTNAFVNFDGAIDAITIGNAIYDFELLGT